MQILKHLRFIVESVLGYALTLSMESCRGVGKDIEFHLIKLTLVIDNVLLNLIKTMNDELNDKV